MAMVYLSVITVVRNGEATIHRCVESVKKNLTDEIEYIVIDGASTDRTLDIVREILPETTILSEPDAGIYDAMNKGLALAHGKFVAFLGCDDFYVPHALQEALVLLHQYENEADVIHGNIIVNGRSRHPYAGPASFHHCRIFHPASFIRRKYYEICGGFSTKYRICADLNFFLKAQEQGARFLYVPKSFTVFQPGGVSTTRRYAVAYEIRKILLAHGYPEFFAEVFFACALARIYAANLLKKYLNRR